jgi:uncharacterized protein YjbI with pentapeptide repeats
MSELDSTAQTPAPLRPTSDRPEAWQAYWKAQKQVWRTESEIDEQRQAELLARLAVVPDIERGLYPFKDVELSRADIEWLLACHDDGHGPIDLDQDGQHERRGLDLRGAKLHKINLTYLPLTRLYGGLTLEEGLNASAQARQAAAITLEECDLSRAHLEQAVLAKANLDGAILLATHLEGSDLGTASLRRAILGSTHLEGCDLTYTQMERANLIDAYLDGADLRGANMERANLLGAHLAGTDLRWAHLEGVNFNEVHLEGRMLSKDEHARVQRGKRYFPQQLPPADLRQTFFSSTTSLENAHLGDEKYGFVSLADVHWNGVNLTVINWQNVSRLGDEDRARQSLAHIQASKQIGAQHLSAIKRRQLGVILRGQEVNDTLLNYVAHSEALQQWIAERTRRNVRSSQLLGITQPFEAFDLAVRACYQLSSNLQAQGLNVTASRFAYRAQVLQRQILLRKKPRKPGAYLFSLFLDLLAGYGYRPGRSLAIYLVTIIGFALTYYLLGVQGGLHIPPLQALVLSVVSFHGRGLFPVNVRVDTLITTLAACEAVIGLIIEISFIATFTSRFFGR